MRTKALLAAGEAEGNVIRAKSSDATATSLARISMFCFSSRERPGTGKAHLNRLNAALRALRCQARKFAAPKAHESRLTFAARSRKIASDNFSSDETGVRISFQQAATRSCTSTCLRFDSKMA